MRKALGAGFFLVLVLALTIPAGADLVNFDSITTTTYAVIPTGYAGFTWDTNFYVVANTWYNPSYGNTETLVAARRGPFLSLFAGRRISPGLPGFRIPRQ